MTLDDSAQPLNNTVSATEEGKKTEEDYQPFEPNLNQTSNLFIAYMQNDADLINNKTISSSLEETQNGKINIGTYYWTIRQHSSRIGNLITWMTARQAFSIWSKISNNVFIYTEPKYFTDFNIIFGKQYHRNSKGGLCYFNSQLILGHAYFPDTHLAGDIHINDDQIFNKEKYQKSFSLLHLFTHEIGHTLGLLHNQRRSSIMYPYEKANRHLDLNLNIFDYGDHRALYT